MKGRPNTLVEFLTRNKKYNAMVVGGLSGKEVLNRTVLKIGTNVG